MEGFPADMTALNEIDFFDPNTPQSALLSEALRLAGYDAVAAETLSYIAVDPDMPEIVKGNIRAMAFYMASLNGGNPDAGSILHTIATAPWSVIGVADESIPALTTENRLAIIELVMMVCQQIINAEAGRLTALAELDVTITVPDPDPENE